MLGLYMNYRSCDQIAALIDRDQISKALDVLNTTTFWCPFQTERLIQYLSIYRGTNFGNLISILSRFSIVWQEYTIDLLSKTADLDQIIADHLYLLKHNFNLKTIENSLARYCFNLETCIEIFPQVEGTQLEMTIRREILRLIPASIESIELMAQYYHPSMGLILVYKCHNDNLEFCDVIVDRFSIPINLVMNHAVIHQYSELARWALRRNAQYIGSITHLNYDFLRQFDGICHQLTVRLDQYDFEMNDDDNDDDWWYDDDED